MIGVRRATGRCWRSSFTVADPAPYACSTFCICVLQPGNGTHGTGRSPKRQVRLPEDLDAALQARIDAEQRTASEIMRDALTQYLAS
ncbi:CopG family ribbon-helix-helix protein [Actinomyces israelii]|uniref:CopG family ribbon-helix-helix protein n=1 Tax=Actinomyces israelii TaxID=1659 RepID=UPI003C6BDADB